MRGEAFHEWPLVAFTTLAITGGGLLMTPALAGPAAASATGLLGMGIALLGLGLLVSLGHLGRPRRSPLALARLGHSRLSAEVALAGVSLAAGTLALASDSPWLAAATALAAAAFLMSLGLVYALPGQPAWRGAGAASALVLGLGLGALAVAATSPVSLPGSGVLGLLLGTVLAADLLCLAARWRRLAVLAHRAALVAHPRAFAERNRLLAARFLLADALPAALTVIALADPARAGAALAAAAAALAAGILVDRVAFYLLAAQETIEAEIDTIELEL